MRCSFAIIVLLFTGCGNDRTRELLNMLELSSEQEIVDFAKQSVCEQRPCTVFFRRSGSDVTAIELTSTWIESKYVKGRTTIGLGLRTSSDLVRTGMRLGCNLEACTIRGNNSGILVEGGKGSDICSFDQHSGLNCR